MIFNYRIVALIFIPLTAIEAFQLPQLLPTISRGNSSPRIGKCESDLETEPISSKEEGHGRREFIVKQLSPLVAAATFSFSATTAPKPANAGIDVTGLPVEGTGGYIKGSSLAEQVKGYETVKTTPVQEIKKSAVATISSDYYPSSDEATYALRKSQVEGRMSKVGFGLINRYEDRVLPPNGSKSRYVDISFEFPSDWLQLDRINGGIQYVDQRNGDKLYLLRAPLPQDATLETVKKSFFGDAIFDPKGSIASSGQVVDEYKVKTSELRSQIGRCPPAETAESPTGACSIFRRRVLMKYYTVTGNGLRVERRGLVDAYQVDSDVYMLMTSSNAVKFEAKGKERETVEAIVDSFRAERG